MKILKFWAPWCGPCKVLKKQLANFDICEVEEYNIEDEENDGIVEKYGVRNIPLMVLIGTDGNELKRWCGAISNMEEFKNEVNSFKS